MREITADTDALLVAFRRHPVGPRMLIAKRNPLMGIIANRLHALPARRHAAKQRPGKARKFLGVAVAAAQQIDQHVIRQIGDFQLLSGGCDLIRQAAIGDPKVVPNFDQTGGCNYSGAGVAEHIDVVMRWNVRRESYLVLAQEIARARRLNAEHQDHWGFLEALKRDVVAGTNFHVASP